MLLIAAFGRPVARSCRGTIMAVILKCVNVLRWPFEGWRPSGPKAAANAVTMGLLLRGKGSSAADVLTTEHDTSLAEDDVTLNSFGLDYDTRMTSQWCHGSSALRQRSPTPAGSCR